MRCNGYRYVGIEQPAFVDDIGNILDNVPS